MCILHHSLEAIFASTSTSTTPRYLFAEKARAFGAKHAKKGHYYIINHIEKRNRKYKLFKDVFHEHLTGHGLVHAAVRSGSLAMAQLVLEHGADKVRPRSIIEDR